MINGAHAIIYSRNAEADRAFLRDVLGLPHVDVGDGWLIFALPPSEVAVHPSKADDHELYFLCDDVKAFSAAMKKRKIAFGPIEDRGWGLLTALTLPGGGNVGVYQPRHARPRPARTTGPSRSRATRAARGSGGTRRARAAPRAARRR